MAVMSLLILLLSCKAEPPPKQVVYVEPVVVVEEPVVLSVERIIIETAINHELPSQFVLALAMIENTTLDPSAVNKSNKNGTLDLGLMQLNTCWYVDDKWQDPERNVNDACKHINRLRRDFETYVGRKPTWWETAIVYNCGVGGFMKGVPGTSLNYAEKVMEQWQKLDPYDSRAWGGK